MDTISPPHTPLLGRWLLSIALFGSYVVLLAGLRVLFVEFHPSAASEVPEATLHQALIIGTRFDAAIAAYGTLPAVGLFLLRDPISYARALCVCSAVVMVLLTFLAVVELDFYTEFHQRLNDLAFAYLLRDPWTVLRMIARYVPIAERLLLLFAIALPATLVVTQLPRLVGIGWSAQATSTSRVASLLIIAALLFIAGRSRVGPGPPLRWGDSHFSDAPFANHVALNTPYSLWSALRWSSNGSSGLKMLYVEPTAALRERVQQMLLGIGDTPVDGEAARRDHTTAAVAPVPRHLVVILMESFSAHYVGAVRGYQGITPEFDALATEGALFTHFFSNGTHTHQGTFATLACFPNLPGHEFLMEQPVSAQRFSGLHALLEERVADMIYVYNGDFRWDNQNGFFRNQGLEHFIGRNDFVNPKLVDPTWGVSDGDMFNRALQELAERTPKGPIAAVLQTLSNHAPFRLTDTSVVPAVTDAGAFNAHLTAMRYADHALGRFFAAASQQPYFADTLFVLIGDHGFALGNQAEEIDLERFHVPLLIIGPGVRERLGARVTRVASQVDVVPTVMELLGLTHREQCWGRSLVGLPDDDPGFAVLKPSGADPIIGLVRGDELLVLTPSTNRFYRWSVAHTFTVWPLEESAERARLRGDLTSYVTAAREKLVARDLAP